VALTLAAAGYPDSPHTGDEIRGIDDARAAGALVFGAGVAQGDQGVLVTAGGRVLTVVGRGSDLAAAADAAYEGAARIDFAGKTIRRDIGRSVAEVAA
jgi:phosphoribosylamine--glycine ligase